MLNGQLRALGVAAVAAMVWTAPALAGGKDWIADDMDKAMSVAKEQNKNILVEFTGSDWCPPCMKMKEEVFSKDSFNEKASKDYVLVVLDFPNSVPQTEAVKAHNRAWQEKFRIEGFPTVVLTDAEGRPFAQTVGYTAGGPEVFLKKLDGFKQGKTKRDSALEAATKADGVDRARHLDKALSLEGIIVPDADKLIDEIIALDAENTAGLKAKYQQQRNNTKAMEAMNANQGVFFGGDTAAALAKFDEIEKEFSPTGEALVQFAGMKAFVFMQAQRNDEAKAFIEDVAGRDGLKPEERQQIMASLIQMAVQSGDMDAAREVAERVISIAPDSEFSGMIRDFMTQFEGEG